MFPQHKMYPCSAPNPLVMILIMMLSLTVSHAFITPRTFPRRILTSDPDRTSVLILKSQPPMFDFPGTLLTVDVGMDDAFTDSISFADGTIRNMVIAFGVFVLLLVGLKSLTNQMDEAIQQVLVDFEATLRRDHAKRWERIEEELQGLGGDERDVKLLQIMEQLQEKEPDFMSKVKGAMEAK